MGPEDSSRVLKLLRPVRTSATSRALAVWNAGACRGMC